MSPGASAAASVAISAATAGSVSAASGTGTITAFAFAAALIGSRIRFFRSRNLSHFLLVILGFLHFIYAKELRFAKCKIYITSV
jgi:hypothetical protein